MYYIKQLVNSHFGRKPNFNPFIPTSPSGPPPAPVLFASSSQTPGPSAPAPINTPIYPTQPPGTRPTPATYGTPAAYGTPALHTSRTRPTSGAYMQPSGPTSAAYMQPSGPTSVAYIQPSETTSATYMQPSGTGPTPAVNTTIGVHNQPAYTPLSGTGPTPGAYMEPPSLGLPPTAYTPPGTGLTPAVYMLPSGTGPIFTVHTQPSGIAPTFVVHIYLSGIGPTSAVYTQPLSIGPAHTVQNPPPTTSPPVVMLNTSTGHGRELSNLAKIYTDNTKYSGRKDSFTFKLAIFHDICLRADIPPETKMKDSLLCSKAWLLTTII